MRVLDQVLVGDDVPDPGEAYWANFAPRVARRLEAGTGQIAPAIPVGRPVWGWVKRLVPVVGVAAMAVLIGRGTLDDQKPDSLPDSRAPAESAALPGQDAIAPEEAAIETLQPRLKRAASATVPSGSDETPPAEGMTAQTGLPATPHEAFADSPQGTDGHIDLALATHAEPPDAATDDSEGWPERKIHHLGQVAADTQEKVVAYEQLFADQGSISEYERRVARIGLTNETAGVNALPGRLLEGPRLLPPGGFADTETPAQAMRRFDEIRELRSMIGDLQDRTVADLTSEERTYLCALWYRLGSITDKSVMVDSAISVLDQCLKTLGDSELNEWYAKREQLISKRQLMEGQ